MSIKLKIILSFLMIIIVVLVSFQISAQNIIGKAQSSNLELQLSKAERDTKELIGKFSKAMLKQVRLIASLPTLISVIEDGSSETVKDSTSIFYEHLDTDILASYDIDGEFITSIGEITESVHEELLALAEDGIEGNSNELVLAINDQKVLVVYSPVGLEDDPSGVLVSVKYLDNDFMSYVKNFIKMDVLMLAGDRISASTLPENVNSSFLKHNSLSGDQLISSFDEYQLHTFELGSSEEKIGKLILFYHLGNYQQLISDLQNKMVLLGILALTGSLMIVYLIASKISKPIQLITSSMKEVASGDGDLTRRLNVTAKDETGELAEAFNTFINTVHQIIIKIQEDSIQFGNRANEIAGMALEISENSDLIAGETNKVSTSTKSMSNQVQMMSAASSEMLNKAKFVAKEVSGASVQMDVMTNGIVKSSSSIQEVDKSSSVMLKMIGEIVSKTDLGDKVAGQAVVTVNQATEKVTELADANKKIGDVIDSIIEISEQTKNLALNATIEAARAGEAGKGFAVVANEVKDLAKQTNLATENIRDTIQLIQASTDETVSQIHGVVNVINELIEIVSDISKSVGEQKQIVIKNSEVTSDTTASLMQISNTVNDSCTVVHSAVATIHEVATGTEEVFHKADATSSSINEVVTNVQAITDSVNLSKENTTSISSATEKLVGIAHDLESLVNKFKV